MQNSSVPDRDRLAFSAGESGCRKDGAVAVEPTWPGAFRGRECRAEWPTAFLPTTTDKEVGTRDQWGCPNRELRRAKPSS
jgi:hypothetical protein